MGSNVIYTLNFLQFALGLIILIFYMRAFTGKFLWVCAVKLPYEHISKYAVDVALLQERAALIFLLGFIIYYGIIFLINALETLCHFFFEAPQKWKFSGTNALMNFVTTFILITLGAMAIHNWNAFNNDDTCEAQQAALTMSCLVMSLGGLTFAETLLSFLLFQKNDRIFIETD